MRHKMFAYLDLFTIWLLKKYLLSSQQILQGKKAIWVNLVQKTMDNIQWYLSYEETQQIPPSLQNSITPNLLAKIQKVIQNVRAAA